MDVIVAIDATTKTGTISPTRRRRGGVLAELRNGWLTSQLILCILLHDTVVRSLPLALSRRGIMTCNYAARRLNFGLESFLTSLLLGKINWRSMHVLGRMLSCGTNGVSRRTM